METFSYILLAFVLFMIVRTIFADRSPIPESSTQVHKPTSAAELDVLLKSNTHVVVDFYADWCPPCRAIAPVFSELADRHSSNGYLAFAKVNVDHLNDVAGRYGVSAMPTFVFFESGKLKGVKVVGIRAGPSVQFSGDGLVERIKGADRAALMTTVKALASRGFEKEE